MKSGFEGFNSLILDLSIASMRFEQNDFKDTLYELKRIKRKINLIIRTIEDNVE